MLFRFGYLIAFSGLLLTTVSVSAFALTCAPEFVPSSDGKRCVPPSVNIAPKPPKHIGGCDPRWCDPPKPNPSDWLNIKSGKFGPFDGVVGPINRPFSRF